MSRTSARLPLLGRQAGVAPIDRVPQPPHQRQLEQLVDVEQAGAKPVVDVVIVIGNVVGNRGDLRFEAWPASELEIPFGIGLGHRPGRRGDGPLCLASPSSASQLKLSPSKSG